MIVVAQTVLNTIHQGRAENMWSIWLLFLAVDLLIPGAYALTLHRREIPSIVTLNIQRKDILDPVGRDRVRRKRDNTVGQRLDNEVPQCSCCFFFFSCFFSYLGFQVSLPLLIFPWVGNSLLLQHHSWYTWAGLALSTRYWQ